MTSATVAARLTAGPPVVPGIGVAMAPVQDLTVDARSGRAQFQYNPGDAPVPPPCPSGPALVAALRQRPELRHVSLGPQDGGLRVNLDIDRVAAARFGHPAQGRGRHPLRRIRPAPDIDHVHGNSASTGWCSGVLPDNGHRDLTSLDTIHLPTAGGGQDTLSSVATASVGTGPTGHQPQGQFRPRPSPLTWPRQGSRKRRGCRGAVTDALEMPERHRGSFQGAARAFWIRSEKRNLAHPGRPGHGLYRARRHVRELHPSGDHPVHLAPAGVGAVLP